MSASAPGTGSGAGDAPTESEAKRARREPPTSGAAGTAPTAKTASATAATSSSVSSSSPRSSSKSIIGPPPAAADAKAEAALAKLEASRNKKRLLCDSLDEQLGSGRAAVKTRLATGLSVREGVLGVELAQKAYQLNVHRGFESDLALLPEPDLTQQAAVDPRVNRIYEQLEHKVKEAQAAMKTAEDDLKATQFRQDSDIGVEVMAEARRNLDYNTLLGSKLSSEARSAVQAEMNLQTELAAKLTASQKTELPNYIEELDRDLDEAQARLLALRRRHHAVSQS